MMRHSLSQRRFVSLFVWIVVVLQQDVFGLASITNKKPIPITVFSGFLGSGKTSLLQHLLQNKEGLRIAVIVNDVASVNIDSKLIASSTEGASGMVELQNGCACCSKSEELLASVSELVMLSDMKGDDQGFHHIVVELSGVADPKSVRAKFQEAIFYDMPLMDRVQLDTMVTVVDCSSFLHYLVSSKTANTKETPELFYRDGEEPPPPSQDWMNDLPRPLLEALLAGGSELPSDPELDSGVSELLVGQTETADVVLLNKVDLVEEDLSQISQVVTALNPRAKIYETQYGKIDLDKILGVAGGQGAVEAGIVDDHRDAVTAALLDDNCSDPVCNDPSHDHDHAASQHDHDHAASHDHDHAASHDHEHAASHDHEHAASHDHGHDHDCSEPDCNDHSHSHEHACEDSDCTDASHSHEHSHTHQEETHAGIGTFVYRARRPFHPQRMLSLLRKLPVVRGLPEHDDSSQPNPTNLSPATCIALQKTLRSKGFAWCADSNVAALYWSHAGASFDMQCLGRWWSTLPRDQWPPEAIPSLLADFDDAQHSEDGSGDTVGDRRQEIVFIGQGLGEAGHQKSLQDGLDQCLVNDEEWANFRAKRGNEEELRAAFFNPIAARMVSY